MKKLKQQGSALIVVLALGGLVALFAAIFAMSYISIGNRGNELEMGVKAEWTNNKNVLSQYVQKIQEAAQIPDMQRDDLAKVFVQTTQARYGANGSQAMMQWIKEQNPQLDSKVYVKLQQLIEAGRDEFKNAQTKLIDKKRNYETQLGYFYTGFFLKLNGYPKVPLDTYNIVTNDYTEDAFKSGKEKGPLKLR